MTQPATNSHNPNEECFEVDGRKLSIEEYLDQDERKDLLRLLTAGSVDDGKSTLIGRLLFDSKKLYEDQLSALERLYEYLCTSETDENHFYDYRNILEWFHFSCYFNVGNKKRFEEEINKKAILDEQANIMLYSTRIESLMNSRYNLLALSSAEWLAKISEQHPAHKLWTDIDYRGSVFFTVTKEDEQFIYVKDLFQDDTLKVNKNSIQLDDFGEFLNGNSVMVTNMFKFGNAWWQNGALLSYPLDKKMKEVIDKEKDEKLHKQMLLDYELVKKANPKS